MFSKGQIVFAGFFVVAFAAVLWVAYRKDRRLHLKNYQGAAWVGVAFLVFVLVLFAIKYTLKG